MGAKFDGEDLMNLLASVMQNNGALNVQITAIETEKATKGQSLTPGLSAIADGSYYPQTWNDKILNSNPAIFYGIEDVDSLDGGGTTAKTYLCFVEIILIDSGQTNDVWKRISRYSRALEEIFENAFDAAAEAGKVKIKQVRPISFKADMDSSEEIKVGGISISVSIV